MKEKTMTPILVSMDEVLLDRIDAGHAQSPYASRLEFIRYLLDMAITEWERHNG